MQSVYEFLKSCGTYYLATLDGDRPRVRPFGTVDVFDGGLNIQTGRRKEVSRQLHENPNLEICAFADGRWLRLSGKAVEDPRTEAKKHMLDSYPELRSMYDENDGNTEIFRITEATAVFSSFTEPPRIVNF